MRKTVHRMAITKARINLGQVARRAHVNREYFILEKDGIPVAGILARTNWRTIWRRRSPGSRLKSAKAVRSMAKGRDGMRASFWRNFAGAVVKSGSRMESSDGRRVSRGKHAGV